MISLTHLLSNNLMSIPKNLPHHFKADYFHWIYQKQFYASNCNDELLICQGNLQVICYIIVSKKITVYLYMIIYVVLHRTAIFVNNILCIFFNVLKDMWKFSRYVIYCWKPRQINGQWCGKNSMFSLCLYLVYLHLFKNQDIMGN